MNENEVAENEVQDIESESITEDVPAELQGLSEETIKETMAEMDEQEDAEDGYEPQEDDISTAEPDSVNKQSTEVFERPKQKIPYERFKEKLDENKSLRAELEKLKAERAQERASAGNNIGSEIIQQNQQDIPQENQVPTQPQFTAEQAKSINDAIDLEAMAMSGLTKEDVGAIPYMDDDDERLARWKVAHNMATAKVMTAIEQSRQQHIANAKVIMEQNNKFVEEFNTFVKQQQADPSYEAVRNYATGDYFNNLSQNDKLVISEAYARIDRNGASPQDLALIKRYFKDAKASFKKSGGRNTNAAARAKQATALPRSGQVEGSAASVGSPSVAALERMLNEKSWDDIPDEYKNLLKGL